MNGVQTELNCKPNVKRCKRFVFPEYSPLLYHNTLKTKAIKLFQADHILTRFVFPPLEYTLTPGEKATYSSVDKALKITKADVHVETGWCNDYLIFDSEPLIDVIEQIERWYGVEIELKYPQIAQDLLSGSFRHENIQNVIHSLSLQYKFKYEIHKDKIIIY